MELLARHDGADGSDGVTHRQTVVPPVYLTVRSDHNNTAGQFAGKAAETDGRIR